MAGEIARGLRARRDRPASRRGTVHDMGRSATHRAIISSRRLVEGKSTSQAVQETFHSPEEVVYYVLAVRQIPLSRDGGMSEGDTARATGHSPYLVREYLDLTERFGLPHRLTLVGRRGVQSSGP